MLQVQLNDFPKFDSRVADLFLERDLNLLPRTDEDIYREFDQESWGLLASAVKKAEPSTIVGVDDLYCDPNEQLIVSIQEKLFSTNQKEAYEKLISVFSDSLSNVSNEFDHHVELGCGYGSKIFNLMDRPGFEEKTFSAAEFSPNGRDLTSFVSKLIGREIDVGFVDFNSRVIDETCVPKGSIIYTSYALHYMRDLNFEFWKFIEKLQPKAFIAFEPCYELYGNESLLGLLRQKYHLKHRYTKNIASSFSDFCSQRQKRCSILPNVFGLNPLLPISVLTYEL